MQKQTLALACVLVALTAFEAVAYDPFILMPGEAGSYGADLGLYATDLGSLGDHGVLFAAGKYSVDDRLEVGAIADLGFIHDDLSGFSTLTVGVKYGLDEKSALFADLLLPIGDVDDAGIALGALQTAKFSGIDFNNLAQVQILDGFTGGAGINLRLWLEPYRELNEKITGYLDLDIHTNTDSLGDWLGVDLAPNADYLIAPDLTLNAGLILGLLGDMKADDLGIMITAIKDF
jgi:hypothetical protein